jgi:hypothetical protein
MSSLSEKTRLKEITKWNRLAETWSLSAPPAVPSIEEIQIYEECLMKYKTKDMFCVVILGSTKELRKIFLNNPELADTRVYCIDWSERMYSRNTEIGQINNPNEYFLCEDWQKFDLGGEYADVILGDKSIDNVPYPLWKGLFGHLQTILRPGGGLILHLGLNTEQFEGISFESALKKWGTKLETGKISIETAASGLWEDCLSGSAFIAGTDPHVCSVSKYDYEINEFKAKLSSITDTTMVSLFQEFIHLFGPSNNDEWTAYIMDDVRESSATFFDVKDVYFSKDYEAAPSSPIIELIKPI